MNEHAQQAPVWAQYIPFAIIPIVFLLRARRMTRSRPLKIGQLWIVPAIYSLVVIGLYAAKPPHGTGWLVCLLGLAAGAVLGWQRGKTIRLHLDPATGALHQQGSLMGLLFLLVLVVVKTSAKTIGERLGFDIALATDALAALALGMFTAMRLEMFLRARQILATARPA